jgi:hypothetical protein
MARRSTHWQTQPRGHSGRWRRRQNAPRAPWSFVAAAPQRGRNLRLLHTGLAPHGLNYPRDQSTHQARAGTRLQEWKLPALIAAMNEDQPVEEKTNAGPFGVLESRTGMPAGWWSRTSRQLPPWSLL